MRRLHSAFELIANLTILADWLVKARRPASPSGLPPSMVRPSVTYSGALSRSSAIRVAPSSTIDATATVPPIRPMRPRFDLDDPDGRDCHAVLEPVEYGSLSLYPPPAIVPRVPPQGPFAAGGEKSVGR